MRNRREVFPEQTLTDLRLRQVRQRLIFGEPFVFAIRRLAFMTLIALVL